MFMLLSLFMPAARSDSHELICRQIKILIDGNIGLESFDFPNVSNHSEYERHQLEYP